MEERESYQPSLIRLWRVFRTCKEMCLDRGYEILEEDCQISLASFAEQYGRADGEPDRTRMAFSAQPSEEMLLKYTPLPTKTDPTPTPKIGNLWIEFNQDENVGTKQIRDFLNTVVAHNHYSGILICAKPVSSTALKMMRGSALLEGSPPGGMEVFVEQDLLVNITKHELVPKHVLLSQEEKKQLLQRYRLKETQLPRIQVTDPVAKYLGLKRGSVVKIIRKSETAGRYASYRWAI